MDFSTRNTSFISTFKWANSEVVFKKKENDKGKDGERKWNQGYRNRNRI